MINRLIQNRLKTDCHASREFLLNTPIIPKYRIERHPPGEAQVQQLKNKFPGMKDGEGFIADCVQELKDKASFGAMAIRIDEIESKPTPMDAGIEDDHWIRLAGVLDEIATRNNAHWGLVYKGILGLFIPEQDESGYKAAAEDIRSIFSLKNRNSISIGIAGYPSDDFPRDGIMDNALKALDHAAFLGPNTIVGFNAVSLNISGDRLYAKGDLQGSINEFQRSLRLDPSNINVRNSLGVCYGVLKQYPKALSEFEAAIRLAPGEVMAVYNYGLVKMLTHHPNQALDYFLQAEMIRDDIFEVAFHIGKAYLQLDQPDKGLVYLNKAESLNPNTASVYRLIGRCHTMLGAQDQAVAAYTQAVRINPNDAESLSDLGRQYDLRNENLEIALLFCKRSTQIDPKNGRFHHRLGRLYLKAEKLPRALEAFEKAAALGYNSQTAIDEINEMLAGNVGEISNM